MEAKEEENALGIYAIFSFTFIMIFFHMESVLKRYKVIYNYFEIQALSLGAKSLIIISVKMEWLSTSALS